MKEKVTCAERLREALEIRNLRQSDLCELTGIPKSAMSQYVSGAFEPKQDRVELIAKALNVTEAWLMGYEFPMERKPLGVMGSGIQSHISRLVAQGFTVEQAQNPDFLNKFYYKTEEEKPTIVSDDELWKALNDVPAKATLARWIMTLEQDDREKFMQAISMYSQLDAYDRGGIIERMAVLLEQDKYAIRKTSSNGKAV